ncbi:MAG: GtrA family protein [Candidatus Taylorbacteria bacterium]|nr:GtrA family protein [Candidatus Taylorbacteria bacterium]
MIHLLREWEEQCFAVADRRFPKIAPQLRKRARFLRYLISGSTSAVIDFVFLYLFTDVFGMHYLVSAVLAFVVAFFSSFFLQKFWTFEDDSVERVHTQMTMYFVVAGVNLALNTALMYLFVAMWGIWYMAAQFLASGLIACESFFISRMLFSGKKRVPTNH